MDQNTIRLLVGLLLVGLLVSQGVRASTRPNRRRGFYAAAAALALLLGYSWASGAGVDLGVAGAALLVTAAVLLLVAAVSLVRAYRAGELRAAGQQFQAEMRRFGEERSRDKKKS